MLDLSEMNGMNLGKLDIKGSIFIKLWICYDFAD